MDAFPPPAPPAVDDSVDAELERELLRCLPRLRTYLARRAGAAGDGAEDLAQEAALRALAYRGSFQADRPLWPWLRQLADRVRFDYLRKRGRTAGERDVEAVEDEPRAATERLTLEVREDLERALRPLKPMERELLMRFHGHGQPIAEIAADIGRPEGTIKSDLWRARRKLAALPDVNAEGASQ
ncbi:MAG: RNA polymerase sigma factor [Planctomycetota bacterium]